jgi:hypothetical protein
MNVVSFTNNELYPYNDYNNNNNNMTQKQKQILFKNLNE